MLSKTKLQKTVKKQRQALKELLFTSMSKLATECSKKMRNRQALENILSDEMNSADYCKYLWVLDNTGRQLTDDIMHTGFKHGQVGRDRVA